MKLGYQIDYFGVLAERRGLASESLIHSATTPAQLYADLCSTHCLGLAMEDIRTAVNDEFSTWDRPLVVGDRIAFLPPMSGG